MNNSCTTCLQATEYTPTVMHVYYKLPMFFVKLYFVAMSFLHVLFYFSVCSICCGSKLICDSTTDVCPGTELTCTCTVPNFALKWYLPGSRSITFTENMGVGCSEKVSLFFAVITNNTGGKESVLKYNATMSLVNNLYDGIVKCEDFLTGESDSMSIIVTFAG